MECSYGNSERDRAKLVSYNKLEDKWGGREGFIAAVFYCVTAYPQPYIDLLICLVIVFRVNRIALVVGELASQKNWKKHLKQTELQT